MKLKNLSVGVLSGALGVLALMWVGCETGTDAVRNTSVNIDGYYYNSDKSINNGRMVANNTGKIITSMDIIQQGDTLQAVDNNGSLFTGRIEQYATSGTISNSTVLSATFSLEGQNTAGNKATISGAFNVQGTTAIMNGTWIEDTLYSTVYATATVAPPSPSNSLAVSPSGTIQLSMGASTTISASGGQGSYTWTLSNGSIGTLSAASGASVTYNATKVGSQIVTVSDGNNATSVSITQGTATTLSMSPYGTISLSITTNASQAFTASGGTSTYTWSLGNNALGSLSVTSGNTTTYKASVAGTQSVTLSDGSATVICTVNQLP